MVDKKISELTAAAALTGTELIEAVQGGDNVKTTAAAIAALGGGGGMAIGGAVTSGTAKSVLFVDGSGNLGQDNANLNYDSATYALTLGASGNLGQFKLGVPSISANPAGVITIIGPQFGLGGSGSYTLYLPDSAGNAGQIIQSDGTRMLWGGLAAASTGGGANTVLYSDGSSLLQTDPGNLDYNDSTKTLNVSQFANDNYFIDTPTTGTTVDMTGYYPIYTEIIDPAGTLLALTIKLPDVVVDGQILRIKFTQVITNLTINPNTGDSVKGAPTTVALGGVIECMFTGTAGSGTWYC